MNSKTVVRLLLCFTLVCSHSFGSESPATEGPTVAILPATAAPKYTLPEAKAPSDVVTIGPSAKPAVSENKEQSPVDQTKKREEAGSAEAESFLSETGAPFELQDMQDINEELFDQPVDQERAKAVEKKEQEAPAAEEKQKDEIDEDERIEFQFENTDLNNVIEQISQLFNVTFITDDIINPLGPGGKSVKGFKLSFRTHEPMTKNDAWNLFTRFLDIAGFALIPDTEPSRYRIISAERAMTAPVPSFIGTESDLLPDSDQIIRYVYFIENSNLETIGPVIDKLRNPSAGFVRLDELKAFILTDRSYNIKVLMKIVKELDKVTSPQAMSVLKLRRAEAKDVETLYNTIVRAEEGKVPMFPGQRKPSTALYFPENTRVIAEPRTNSLIILGSPDAIEKIEDFVKKNVDKDPERPYSPLYHYELKYADAKTVAQILTDLAKFGEGTPAAVAGGIRGGDKYFKPIKFIPDVNTNRIIIRGDYQDYLAFKEVIAQLDKPQYQIAIEVLILEITLNDQKALGAALRKKEPSGWDSAISTKVAFQTSGFNGQGILTRDTGTGNQALLANLINLVKGMAAGNTVLSLGFDQFGVWGVFRALESIASLEVVANPFLVASNKQKARVSVGEKRRVVTAVVQGAGSPTNSLSEDDASLTVTITPQINSDGKIVLNLNVALLNYITAITASNVAKNKKEIDTAAVVSDREILALGGLIQNTANDSTTKVPILGDVPILGWLFKNRDKKQTKDNLLILISAQIIESEEQGSTSRFSQNRIDDYQSTLQSMELPSDRHDPINNWFFKSQPKSVEKRVENFIFKKPEKRKRVMKKEHDMLADSSGQGISALHDDNPYGLLSVPMTTALGNDVHTMVNKTLPPRQHKRRHGTVSLTEEEQESDGDAA